MSLLTETASAALAASEVAGEKATVPDHRRNDDGVRAPPPLESGDRHDVALTRGSTIGVQMERTRRRG
jgi:hypothetical protein